MKPIRQLLEQHKELRYLIAGGSSEVIEYASFGLLMLLTHALYVSNSISFFLGIASGFVFHKLWSFAGDHQFKTHNQLVTYCGLAGFNFVMINVIVGVCVHSLHIHPAIAKLVGMFITAGWSYVAFNWFIFRHNQKSPDAT